MIMSATWEGKILRFFLEGGEGAVKENYNWRSKTINTDLRTPYKKKKQTM